LSRPSAIFVEEKTAKSRRARKGDAKDRMKKKALRIPVVNVDRKIFRVSSLRFGALAVFSSQAAQ
jgi:hypothetical protein